MRVILCEDDADIRKMFQEVLEGQGIEVVAIEDGNSAVEALSLHYFDAVLTDFMMKNGDGGLVSRFCNDRGLPCIVFSGIAVAEIRPHIPARTPIIDKLQLIDLAKQGILNEIAKTTSILR